MSRALRRIAAVVGTSGALYAGVTTYTTPAVPTAADRVALAHGGLESIPSRAAQLSRLRSAGDRDSPFDVLVIGGGATGAACALDAALRDLKVALVERDDFSAGTSSRSTKLIHGGVRYLEKAFFNLDPGQLKLVFEALRERAIMMHQAPHLAHPFPTLLPCYKIWEVPFYWVGLKVYDLVAALGHGLLHVSKYISASEALCLFPTLSKASDAHPLRGAIMYYDGQMNDSRFNISVALTAALYGSAVANHTEVVSFIREEAADGHIEDTGEAKSNARAEGEAEGDGKGDGDGDGDGDGEGEGDVKVSSDKSRRVIGARCRDVLTNEYFDVYAKVVLNATGPFADHVRRMEDKEVKPMIVPSAGVHITLPSYYSAEGMGLIVPKTKDGRVVFMLPWLGETIAGTTDSDTEITDLPKPHSDEVGFILDALSDYLRIDVRNGDVQSAWSGIRPLVIDPKVEVAEGKTQNILREHLVDVSDGQVVTITGGKWTTQRSMAEEAVDKAVEVGSLEGKAQSCKTRFVRLVGAHKWDESYFTFLSQRYVTAGDTGGGSGRSGRTGAIVAASSLLDVECAKHLSRAYGDQAYRIAEIAERGYGRRLVEGYPIIEAELLYCMKHEYCETAVDFLARRCRLVFLNGKAAAAVLPHVVSVMARELKWSDERVRQELEDGDKVIASFSCAIPARNAQ